VSKLSRIYRRLGGSDDCQGGLCDCCGEVTKGRLFDAIMEELDQRDRLSCIADEMRAKAQAEAARYKVALQAAQGTSAVTQVLVVDGQKYDAEDVLTFKAGFAESTRLRNRVAELEAETESFRLPIPNVPEGPSVPWSEVDR
jgi:hypothetical protein